MKDEPVEIESPAPSKTSAGVPSAPPDPTNPERLRNLAGIDLILLEAFRKTTTKENRP